MDMREPAEVFPLAQFVGEEMEARGWTSADVAFRMGFKDETDFGLKCFEVDLFLAVQEDGLILPPAFLDGLARAFGVSETFFSNLHEVWRRYPDRRVPYEPPDYLFSKT